MSREKLFTDIHVHYIYMKFCQKILAEETEKYCFLRRLVQAQREWPISVFAFVLLDDEIHFLAGIRKENGTFFLELLSELVNAKTTKRCGEFGKEAQEFMEVCREKHSIPVECEDSFLELVRQIHALPVKERYVSSVRDYWWSSYQTYRGAYQWQCLEENSVLNCFSPEPERGRQLFLKFQAGIGQKEVLWRKEKQGVSGDEN